MGKTETPILIDKLIFSLCQHLHTESCGKQYSKSSSEVFHMYFYYYTLIYVPTAKIDKKLERPTKTQKNS
jgi:hypothetical protein